MNHINLECKFKLEFSLDTRENGTPWYFESKKLLVCSKMILARNRAVEKEIMYESGN